MTGGTPGEDTNWPQFQGNVGHTGATTRSDETAPQAGVEQRWQHSRGGSDDKFVTRPVVSDEYIYVGLYEDNSHYSIDDNYLIALDRETGSMEWSFGIGHVGSEGIPGPPAIAGGTVFIVSHDCQVYAVDAATGHPLWNFETDSPQLSSPVVDDGVVYVSDGGGGNVYALDAHNGGIHQKYEAIQSPTIPVVGDSSVYIGEQFGSGAVVALDITTGNKRWAYYTGSSIQSPPAVYEDTVYVGDDNGTTYSLAADDKECLWTYETAEPIMGAPAADADTVYMISEDDRLHAIAAKDGQQQWSRKLRGLSGTPLLVDDIVYVSQATSISAIDAEIGDVRWTYDHAAGQLAVADSQIYTGSRLSVIALESTTERDTKQRGNDTQIYQNCSNCGAALSEYADLNYCPECGTNQ